MSKIKFVSSFIALIAAVSFVTGCASTSETAKKMPDWVNGPSQAYPNSEYVVGVGSAVDKRSAELDAISELVAVFGQKVTSAAATSQRMERAQKEGLVSYSTESAIDQAVLRELSQDDVIAVEIPEFFESKAEGKWYALAVINRKNAAKIYSSMIEKNQNEISTIINQIQSSKEKNTMSNFSRLDFAEEVAALNEKCMKRLVILDSQTAEQFKSISTPVQIHKMLMEMASLIPVCVVVDDDSDGRITKAFQEVMTSYGFNTTTGSNERYTITCLVHFTESVSADGKTAFCEYAVEAALNDTFMGETIVPLAITGREGAQNYQSAQTRAKQKIVTKVKSDFAKSFQKYLIDFSSFKK